jgi:hypothetical protein
MLCIPAVRKLALTLESCRSYLMQAQSRVIQTDSDTHGVFTCMCRQISIISCDIFSLTRSLTRRQSCALVSSHFVQLPSAGHCSLGEEKLFVKSAAILAIG